MIDFFFFFLLRRKTGEEGEGYSVPGRKEEAMRMWGRGSGRGAVTRMRTSLRQEEGILSGTGRAVRAQVCGGEGEEG